MSSKGGNKMIQIIMGVFSIMGLVVLGMAGLPVYSVWQQEMSGKAEFVRAEQNKRIAIEESRAKLEASKFEADAEIERARGVAEANKIIGDSLKGNESYLRYLWIQGLHDGSSEVIYVPTEANLPILEAGKR
jgi:regulator of protease activity HflC (stomatin/prohibitin superfamily)